MQQIWPSHSARLDDREVEELYRYPADRRWLAVNFVSSADGAVEVDGSARKLTNPADQKILQLASDLADVLLVGGKTANSSRYRGIHLNEATRARRRRYGLPEFVPIAVVTTGRSLPADAPVITGAKTPTIVITCAATPAGQQRAWTDAGAEVVIAGDETVDLGSAIDALAERGLRHIDCEGGPHLFGALLAARLVDELRLTISPLLVSGPSGRIAAGPVPELTGLSLASVLTEDNVMMLRYLVNPE
ncbi:MAG TPA: pyrimidine reductase family protein [Amycolatopsis sp.]|nr:pyrimidine reductase family protein [Amycolatopsis sp.]